MPSNPKAKQRPNIRRIAEHVQLSATTVSLALRDAPSIPAETRARVIEAARELNYVYTKRASRVNKTKVRRIAFVTSDHGDHPVEANPFYGQVLHGAEQACNTHDTALTFSVLLYTHDPNKPLPATLRNAEVDGLVIAGVYPQRLVDSLARTLQCPVVLVDNTLPGLPYDAIMADDFGGGYLATRHLIELGHRQISAVLGHPHVLSLAERYRGYCAACRDAGLEPASPITTSPVWEMNQVRRELVPALRTLPLPHALFCTVDMYAGIALELFGESGVAVPGQLSLVGFDDLAVTRQKYPHLTTIHNQPRMLGELAVERLLARIDGDTRPRQQINVAVQLVMRQTTGPASPAAYSS